MTYNRRRVTKPVYVGGVKVGGGADVTVQSMTKTDTRDVKATVRQIHELEEAGCEIIRSAVPDMEAAQAMAEIKKQIHIPLIADIHFHYKLALECAAGGVDCLRLNPGNLRNADQVREVVQSAKERNIPIRIGVNFGSLPPVGGIGRTPRILPPHGSGQPPAQSRRGPIRRLQRRRSHGGHRTLGNQPAGRTGLRPDQDFHEGL